MPRAGNGAAVAPLAAQMRGRACPVNQGGTAKRIPRRKWRGGRPVSGANEWTGPVPVNQGGTAKRIFSSLSEKVLLFLEESELRV